MKRPMLLCGTVVALAAALLVLCGKAAAVALVLAAASALFLFFFPPLKLRKQIALPTVAAALLAAVAAFAVFTAVRVAPAEALDGVTADVSGTVLDYRSGYDGETVVTVKLATVDGRKTNVKAEISVAGERPDLYDYCSFHGVTLTVPRNGKIPNATYAASGVFLTGEADAANVLWQSARTPLYDTVRLRHAVMERFDKYLPEDEAGLVRGMLFGDKTGLADGEYTNFRACGTAHLLAVSGLHTSLWCGLLLALLTAFGAPARVRFWVCTGFLVFFCALSSFTPSVVRASLMTFLTLAAPNLRRQSDSLNSLGFAAFCIVLVCPYAALAPGFLLSAAATLGVVCSQKTQKKLVSKTSAIENKPLRRLCMYLLTTLAVSVYAALFSLPVSVYFFGVFSLISPLANVLTVELAFLAMLVSALGVALSPLPGYALQSAVIAVFRAASVLLRAVRGLTAALAGIPFASVSVYKPVFFVGFCLFCVLLLGAYFLKKRGKAGRRLVTAAAACVLAVSLLLPLFPFGAGNRLTVYPVGDGCFITLRAGSRLAVITDGNLPAYDDLNEALPRAGSDRLQYLLAPEEASAWGLRRLVTTYAFDEVLLGRSFAADGTGLRGRIVGNGEFAFGKNIALETVDTYHTQCVIIRYHNRVIVISYSSDNSMDLIESICGPADVIVFAGTPVPVSGTHARGIVSGGAETALSAETAAAADRFERFSVTAEDGAVTVYF